jgi:hypothetical protein
MNLQMSVFLVYEMIFSDIVEMNNMYRYSRFAKYQYGLWVANRRDPVAKEMTVNDMYQVWLTKNYDSINGNQTHTGTKKGSIRFQVSNGLQKMTISSQKSLRALWSKLTFLNQDKRPVLTKNSF